MNNTNTSNLPKRTRGKPKQLPPNARRVTIGQLSEEDIALLSLLGKGNITQGIRELCKLRHNIGEFGKYFSPDIYRISAAAHGKGEDAAMAWQPIAVML